MTSPVKSLLAFFLLGCVQCAPLRYESPSITTITSLLAPSEQSSTNSLSSDDSKLLEQGLGCLTPTRLQTIYDFYALASDTPRSSRISLFNNKEWLSNLLYDESTFLVRYKGSRIFKTIEDTGKNTMVYMTLSIMQQYTCSVQRRCFSNPTASCWFQPPS